MEQRPRQFTTIHLASDHAGFSLKSELQAWLVGEGFTVTDHGAFAYNDEDDFPDFIVPAARAVAKGGDNNAGIIFGGSGEGEALAANRVKGARAVVYYGNNESIIPLSREHNDANILSLGARFVSLDEAKRVVWEWLHTPAATDPKYERRNKKLEQLTSH